jgi:hypothetical protein
MGAAMSDTCPHSGAPCTVTREVGALEARVDILEKSLSSIDGKVDQLLAAANMGKGAWFALLKIGGVLVILAGGAAWLLDRLGGGS